MRLFGIAGTRNSGKTTLLTAVVRVLRAEGLAVGTVKEAGRDVDPPTPEAGRMLAAGAVEAAILSPEFWAVTGASPPGIGPVALAKRLEPVDLVLVEGSRSPGYPRLEVWRPGRGRAPLWPGDRDVVAIASDGEVGSTDLPVFDLNDIAAIAAFVLTAAVPLPWPNAQ